MGSPIATIDHGPNVSELEAVQTGATARIERGAWLSSEGSTFRVIVFGRGLQGGVHALRGIRLGLNRRAAGQNGNR
jgi:hypothetical protein